LILAQNCRATELEATTLLILAPIHHPETGKMGIRAIFAEVKGTFDDSISPTLGVQGNDSSYPLFPP